MRGLALALVLVAVALGLCAFDDGGDHHHVPRDLCLGLLGVIVVAPLLAGLPRTGRAPLLVPPSVPLAIARVPVPPPRSFPLAS